MATVQMLHARMPIPFDHVIAARAQFERRGFASCSCTRAATPHVIEPARSATCSHGISLFDMSPVRLAYIWRSIQTCWKRACI